MTILMYDSTDPGSIPVTAPAVQGYPPCGNPALDAGIAWPESAWARFPTMLRMRTARFAFQADCHELDVETGDATPDQIRDWKPVDGVYRVYCNLSTWPAVQANVAAAGLQVMYRIADWTGVPHLVAGSSATQYANPRSSGGNFDLSAVTDAYFAGEDMTPDQDARLLAVYNYARGLYVADAPDCSITQVRGQIAAVADAVAGVPPGSPLTADQVAALAAIPGLVAAVARIEASLKGA